MSNEELAGADYLSPSSMQTYLICARKYWHNKISKTHYDPDAEVDTKAFDIGKAFHKVLELCRHETRGLKLSKITEDVKEFNLTENETLMIAAMISKYQAMHETSGLSAFFCEVEVRTDEFYGFIDVILGDIEGWWISDMKTSASYNSQIVPRLPSDIQLNLYAKHVGLIAEMMKLDVKKFMGCRYRIATKSRLIRGKRETAAEYFERLSSSVKALEVVIPKEHLNPEGVVETFGKIVSKVKTLTDVKYYPQNFTNCLAYHKPCEFWSRCHGQIFTGDFGVEVRGPY